MSVRSWQKSWGLLVPLLQKKVASATENNLLDLKVKHEILNLLNHQANINDLSPMIQCTFLHLCVGKGLLKSAQLLIQKGADTQRTNLFHEKPADYIGHTKYNREKIKDLFISTDLKIQKKSR